MSSVQSSHDFVQPEMCKATSPSFTQLSKPMIQSELTDQQMAIRLIEKMNRRVTFQTIIQRLVTVQSAVEMAGLLVKDKLLNEDQAVEWVERVIDSYAMRDVPEWAKRQPPAAE